MASVEIICVIVLVLFCTTQLNGEFLKAQKKIFDEKSADPIMWRWKSLKCWEDKDSVPCNSDEDCQYPCKERFIKGPFPVACVGNPGMQYCMMYLKGYVPAWMLRNDGMECCWQPLFLR